MINQLLFKRRGSQGPVVPTGPKDPLLNYVSLLLNSDGVNGGANNVFLDSSPNNYSVTKSGTVNQGSFSPFIPGGWSVEMASASSQQLQYPASAEFQISGNWTIECWVWLNNYSTGSSMLIGNYQANSPTDWMLMVNKVGRVDMYHSGLTGAISAGSVPTNAWVHIAAVKSGTTITVYVNGVSVGTTTSSATLGDATRVIRVGGRSAANTYLNGYISNLRVVRSAVYTANFTPPKGALEVIPGVTSLLTCRSNRFEDLSPNNHAVTLTNGGGNIKPMSPQEFSSYYEQSVHGSSMYFAGGSSDYLSVNTGPLNLGSENMTFDCWVYPTSFAATRGLISQWPTATNGCLQVLITTSGTIQQIYRIAGTTVTSTSSRALTLFAWNHVAVVRNGNVFTIFVNGVADTNIITNSGSLDNSTAPVVVGYGGDGLNPMLGYLADVRIVAGTAIYTSSFIPPTTPVTPGSPVEKLLMKGANANIIDRVAKNLINTVGVARIANTAKYGNGSVIHEGGVNNYLEVLNNEGFNFGSSPFTVEAWVNISEVGSGGGGILGRWGYGPSIVTDWLLYIDPSLKPSFVVGGSVVASPNAIAINTWNHVAVTRTGSIYYLWVNGVQVASANIGGTITVGARPIRTSRWDPNTGFLTGYIDDLRVTRGVARYTAAFTPPTEALPIY